MTTRRRWATTSARLAAGTGVSALLVAATVTAVALPWPGHDREAVAVSAQPAPSDSIAACAGPLLALGRDATSAGSVTVSADQDVVAATADGFSEASADILVVPGVGASAPTVFSAPPETGQRTPLAAAGSASAADDDLAGFAASACTPPLLDSWLVGGASTTGSSDLVVVGNPGSVAASVTLTVYGVGGAQTPPGGTFVLAAGTQEIVPLGGLLLGEEAPVVHVAATGAPVQASLQASITRTLEPGGVEQIAPVTAPSNAQVIPGITVTGAETTGAESPTLLRVLAPSAAASVEITATGVGDAEPAFTQAIDLDAALPAAVDLSGLAEGEYTVRIEASSPIVSAVWQTTGFGAGADFAWYPAAPAIDVDSLVAIAEGPAATLVLADAGASGATVTLADSAGAGSPREIVVPAGGSVAVDVAAGEVYALTTTAAVHAGVLYASADALSGYPVWPADADAAPLTVYP